MLISYPRFALECLQLKLFLPFHDNQMEKEYVLEFSKQLLKQQLYDFFFLMHKKLEQYNE